MTDEIAAYLSATEFFGGLSPEEVAEVARHCRLVRAPAGERVLRQGAAGNGIHFLKSGRLAVLVQRGSWRDTVNYVQPPSVVGELSFITGRPCVADVEVVVDAEFVFLPAEAAPAGSRLREVVLRGLTALVAERLRETVARGAKAPESPAVLLRNLPNWEAPRAFAARFAETLGAQREQPTLLVHLDAGADGRSERRGGIDVCTWPVKAGSAEMRAGLASKITEWKGRYTNLVLHPVGESRDEVCAVLGEFVNFQGTLAGPGDPAPEEGENGFVAQSAERPTLASLNGSRQLIPEAKQAEEAWRAGKPLPAGFARAADSLARRVAGTQVGIALGGGAAWGWAHIGVLEVLEESSLPVDVISGCSMGSVIGAFRAAGFSPGQMLDLALYWRRHTKRFLEWRFWKMCLLNERAVRSTFARYFGDRKVNETSIPYWANAVDIQTGREFTVRDGTLVDCIRASIALPGLLPPFERNSHLLVDAGITDPVPVSLARTMGSHFTVAVNAMAEPEGQKIERRYPFNAFSVMMRCMFVMGHEIGQARAERAADILFTPKLGEVTMLDFGQSERIVDLGREAAQRNLDAILAGYRDLKQGGRR
ncbi:MAG: patatin-like phospholipase family protein [Bryobacteraceae bacterium]